MKVFKKALLDAVLEEYKDLGNHKAASTICTTRSNGMLLLNWKHRYLRLRLPKKRDHQQKEQK